MIISIRVDGIGSGDTSRLARCLAQRAPAARAARRSGGEAAGAGRNDPSPAGASLPAAAPPSPVAARAGGGGPATATVRIEEV